MKLLSDLTVPPSVKILTWIEMVSKWTNPPLLVATLPNGIVLSYTTNENIFFRLVPNPYNASQDAFYSEFTGGVLSGLIIARG